MEANIIKKDSNEIVKVKPDFSVAREVMPLDKLMEMSQMLSQSTIVPDTYRNRPENCPLLHWTWQVEWECHLSQ